MFFVDPGSFAAIFILLLFAWPALLSPLLPDDNWTCFALMVNAIIVIWVWMRSTSQKQPFFGGLCDICDANATGCANITLILILPLLCFAYLRALMDSVKGLGKGRLETQNQWARTVESLAIQDRGKDSFCSCDGEEDLDYGKRKRKGASAEGFPRTTWKCECGEINLRAERACRKCSGPRLILNIRLGSIRAFRCSECSTEITPDPEEISSGKIQCPQCKAEYQVVE